MGFEPSISEIFAIVLPGCNGDPNRRDFAFESEYGQSIDESVEATNE